MGILAALAGFVLVCVAALAISECAWASACGGFPWAAIGVGLALALSVVVWMHRTAALVLAGAAAAAWWSALREGDVPAWVTVGVALLVGGAALMALIPWRADAHWPHPTVGQSASSSAQPPAEDRSPWVAPRTTVASIALVAAGAGLAWSLDRWKLPAWLGAEAAWFMWAVLAAGLGLGLGWRAVWLNRSRRRFFSSPQPVRSVQVTEHATGAYVMLPTERRPVVLHFPIRAGFPARLALHGSPHYIWRGANLGSGREQPALLYGEPYSGYWCAVAVGSQLLAPFAPAEAVSDEDGQVETDPQDGEGEGDDDFDLDLDSDDSSDEEEDEDEDEDEDDDEEEPAGESYDPEDLTAVDRSPSPSGVRTHRIAFDRAYALVPLSVAAVVLGAIMVGCLGFVTQRHPSWSVLVALALAGLGAELVWRNLVRPRAVWNDSGIALVTSRKVEYLPWEDVSIIKIGGGLKLFAGSKNYVIPTYSASRWLAPGERGPVQLTAALLDSRRRGAGTPEDYMPPPPSLDYPARSPALLVLWLVSAAALTTAVLTLGHGGT